MAIQTQVWVREIKEQLFPSNAFITRALSDDAFVNHKQVNLPQAGALPGVVRNRTSLPAAISGRTDTVADYTIDEYTSDPTVIQDIEEIETSYEKRQSVLRQHINQLNLKMANWMQYHWAATSGDFIQRTTGDNRTAVVTGATGTRKKITLNDIFAVKNLMDDLDIPEEGRVCLLPSYMYNDLMNDEKSTLLSLEFSGRARVQDGMLNNLLGFELYKRGKNNVLTYSNAGTPVPRDPEANALTSANAAALFWHPDFVRRALGTIKVYSDEDKPEWYGSIFSTMARAGGRKAYSDGTGVVALVEAAGA